MTWTIDESPDNDFMAQQIIDNPTWVAIGSADGHVAYTHPDNAPVIAAAPELLKALEAIEAAKNSGFGQGSIAWIEAERMAKEAIAKARGQA